MISKEDIELKEVKNLYTDFPVITSKTNSGKTTFALTGLADMLEEKRGKRFSRVIFLTPYRRTLNQIRQDDRFVSRVDDLDYFDCAWGERKICVGTYSAACLRIKSGKMDLSGCLVIFDELHRFLQFTTYQEQMKYILQWLLDAERWKSFVAVGMTGTPQILLKCNECENFFGTIGFSFRDITPESSVNLRVRTGEIVYRGSIETVAKGLAASGAASGTMFYVKSVKRAYKLKTYLESMGLAAAFVCSESNEQVEEDSGETYSALMLEQSFEGESILTWIDGKSDLPPRLDALIVNDSAIDGINILDKEDRFKRIVVESTLVPDIVQLRSRIRHDIDRLTVVYNFKYKNKVVDDDVSGADEFCDKYYSDIIGGDEDNAVLLRNRCRLQDSLKKSDILPRIAAFEIDERYYFNPFCGIISQYERDSYKGNYKGNAAQKMAEELQPMLLDSDSEFDAISGSTYNRNVNSDLHNADTLSCIDFISLFRLDYYDSVEISKDEFLELFDSMNLKRNGGKKAGIKTVVKLIEPYISVESKRVSRNGVRSTVYVLKRK